VKYSFTSKFVPQGVYNETLVAVVSKSTACF
jgi:hypothetical protein